MGLNPPFPSRLIVFLMQCATAKINARGDLAQPVLLSVHSLSYDKLWKLPSEKHKSQCPVNQRVSPSVTTLDLGRDGKGVGEEMAAQAVTPEQPTGMRQALLQPSISDPTTLIWMRSRILVLVLVLCLPNPENGARLPSGAHGLEPVHCHDVQGFDWVASSWIGIESSETDCFL